jgi:hypothetical protein
VVDKVALGQVSPEFFGFPLSIPFYSGSKYYYIVCGMNNSPVGGCSSETLSYPIDMNSSIKCVE